MPKRSRSGVVMRPERVVAPTSVKGGSAILTERARRAFADDEIEFEILHRRIEDFLHRRIEAVDLVDEEHVARFEIGEDGGEIAGLGQHRPRGRAEIDAQLARHDLRQRGLAEAGRAGKQHMVERLFARPRRLDEDREIFARLLLADEFGQHLGPQRGFERVLLGALAARQGGRHVRTAALAIQTSHGLKTLRPSNAKSFTLRVTNGEAMHQRGRGDL